MFAFSQTGPEFLSICLFIRERSLNCVEMGRLLCDICRGFRDVGGRIRSMRGAERTTGTPVVSHRDPLVLDHDRTRRCPRLAVHGWTPGKVFADHPPLLSTHPQHNFLSMSFLRLRLKSNYQPTVIKAQDRGSAGTTRSGSRQ